MRNADNLFLRRNLWHDCMPNIAVLVLLFFCLAFFGVLGINLFGYNGAVLGRYKSLMWGHAIIFLQYHGKAFSSLFFLESCNSCPCHYTQIAKCHHHPQCYTCKHCHCWPSDGDLLVNRCVVDNNHSGTIGYMQQPGPVVCGAAYQCGEACDPVHTSKYFILLIFFRVCISWVEIFLLIAIVVQGFRCSCTAILYDDGSVEAPPYKFSSATTGDIGCMVCTPDCALIPFFLRL